MCSSDLKEGGKEGKVGRKGGVGGKGSGNCQESQERRSKKDEVVDEIKSNNSSSVDMIVVVCVPPCRGVSMYQTRDLVDLALKGIPEKYRVEIWMVYTGT